MVFLKNFGLLEKHLSRLPISTFGHWYQSDQTASFFLSFTKVLLFLQVSGEC
jgi:hypothetical protein